MFTELLPEQISKFWDIIAFAVDQSLPPTVGDHPDKMNRILSSCMSGKTQVWASYENHQLKAILLTRILFDDASDTKTLLIYSLYGYSQMSAETWLEGVNALKAYAASKGICRVTAYSDVPRVLEMAKRLGASTKYTLISFEVEGVG